MHTNTSVDLRRVPENSRDQSPIRHRRWGDDYRPHSYCCASKDTRKSILEAGPIRLRTAGGRSPVRPGGCHRPERSIAHPAARLAVRQQRTREHSRRPSRWGPDLVVEILSPSNSRSDLEAKLSDYATLRVSECWLVSPEARSVEILGLTEGSWVRLGISGLGEQVRSRVLPELDLAVVQLFE